MRNVIAGYGLGASDFRVQRDYAILWTFDHEPGKRAPKAVLDEASRPARVGARRDGRACHADRMAVDHPRPSDSCLIGVSAHAAAAFLLRRLRRC